MITTLLLFILVLGLLVFVHEFGHFITAKKMGVKVEEFGFGFPPRMIGFYRNYEGKFKFVFRKMSYRTDRTVYSLNWIPLGGFVKIKGEEGGHRGEPDSFSAKPIWRRAIILASGVAMNMILAIVVLSIGFGIGIPQALGDRTDPKALVRDKSIQIVSVAKGSPAFKAGVSVGDEIVYVDEKKFAFRELQDYLTTKVGKEVTYAIKRDGNKFEKKIVPSLLSETGKGGIGVGLIEVGIVSYPWHLAFWRGITETWFYTREIIAAFYMLFHGLVIGGGGAIVDLSGPVGIAVLTGKVAKLGLIYLMQFVAVLSINLAIINILPFPALDGGRILFLAIEKIRGKPVSQKIESIIHNLGFTALMILVVVVTYNDFVKFGSKFVNLWQSIVQ
jgi:regulator of sigma E protease